MSGPASSFRCAIPGLFKRQSPIFPIFFIFLAVFLLSGSSWARDKSVVFLDDEGKRLCSFKVELAVTPEQQERGLMYRKSLKKDRGMLFIFNTDQLRFFWMKNTYIPLDLVFITSKLEVASICHYAKPLDETTMSSALPVKYVLEINSGESDRCKIKVGSKVQIGNISP